MIIIILDEKLTFVLSCKYNTLKILRSYIKQGIDTWNNYVNLKLREDKLKKNPEQPCTLSFYV